MQPTKGEVGSREEEEEEESSDSNFSSVSILREDEEDKKGDDGVGAERKGGEIFNAEGVGCTTADGVGAELMSPMTVRG